MSYTVLARRYRSSTFNQVVGQEPIAQTLQNAIARGKVHHALLFTGTRGVGKTSMARIFSCALNAPSTVADCPEPTDGHEYPAPDVQERMAEAIMRGDDMNVIEIDGASNRAVDDARQLIGGTGLTPTGNARYKIYIIDEVHMLTREAFNTLLKTMEEPPGHVKFILCTTEAHKVPATIRSRCQRFDFRHISAAAIAEHLRRVLEQEQLTAEDQVIWQVARLANGSMRDALSLLDRLIAARGQDEPGLTGAMLERVLGLPPQQLIEQLVDALADGDTANALKRASGLLETGLGKEQVIDALIERLRQLMLLIACGRDSEVVQLSEEAAEAALKQAQRFDTPGLVHMMALCENLQRSCRNSSNPRALFDASIVRLALAEKMADVTALLRGLPSGQPAQTNKKKVSVRDRVAPPAAGASATSAPREVDRAPAAPPAPSPAPDNASEQGGAAPTIDAGEVWTRVLAAVADKASLGWVGSLRLQQFDGESAQLTTMPGRRELLRFVTPQRSEQLAQLFRQVLGRPVRVEIGSGGQSDHDADAESDPVAGAGADPHASSLSRSSDTVERGRALDLPLVRQVMEHFDASVVDARRKPATEGDAPPVEGGRSDVGKGNQHG